MCNHNLYIWDILKYLGHPVYMFTRLNVIKEIEIFCKAQDIN